jgi:hypothetical protein
VLHSALLCIFCCAHYSTALLLLLLQLQPGRHLITDHHEHLRQRAGHPAHKVWRSKLLHLPCRLTRSVSAHHWLPVLLEGVNWRVANTHTVTRTRSLGASTAACLYKVQQQQWRPAYPYTALTVVVKCRPNRSLPLCLLSFVWRWCAVFSWWSATTSTIVSSQVAAVCRTVRQTAVMHTLFLLFLCALRCGSRLRSSKQHVFEART